MNINSNNDIINLTFAGSQIIGNFDKITNVEIREDHKNTMGQCNPNRPMLEFNASEQTYTLIFYKETFYNLHCTIEVIAHELIHSLGFRNHTKKFNDLTVGLKRKLQQYIKDEQ